MREDAGGNFDRFLRQHRIMGQGDSARDFDPSESMENAGILDVFPIFHTARSGQKIRRSPQYPLCGVAIIITKQSIRHTSTSCMDLFKSENRVKS